MHRHLMRGVDALDFVELKAEQFIRPTQARAFDGNGARLVEIAARARCTVRGSLLSMSPMQVEHMRGLLDRCCAVGLTERAATGAHWTAACYRAFEAAIGMPFLLEVNATTPADCIGAMAECTGCGISLDLATLCADARRWCDRLPTDRIVQLRIAGVREYNGEWRRDASVPISNAMFELLDMALMQTAADSVIVERNGGFFPFAAIFAEVDRARQIFARRRGPASSSWPLSSVAVPAVSDGPDEPRDDGKARHDDNTAGHVAYLRDYLRQQQLIAWALRDAGVGQWR